MPRHPLPAPSLAILLSRGPQAQTFVTFDYACGADGLDAPRQCVGLSCTAFAVIECVPHGELPCEPDEELNIGRGNTGEGGGQPSGAGGPGWLQGCGVRDVGPLHPAKRCQLGCHAWQRA